MSKKSKDTDFDKKSRLSLFIIICLVIAAATALITYKLAVGSFDGREALINAKRYAEIEQIVADNYIGTADEDSMRSAAAAAMVRALGDKWSYYMTAEEYASYKISSANELAGIGMSIVVNSDGKFEISSVEPGTVAGNAGLLAGQTLVSIDGQSVDGMSITEVQNLIRSKLNLDFNIVVRDENGDDSAVTLACAASYKSPVSYKMIDNNVGYIRIKNFEAGSGDDARAAIDFLVSSGATSFVFDLRDNPGGLFDELTKVLDYLLPDGKLFSTADKDGNTSTVSSDKICLKYKMAVIVNGNTYSAAEFFAVTLQEYNWATIVGEQTSGKSRNQVTIELSNGDAIHISTEKYLTSKGVDLAEVGGVTPNVVIAPDSESESDVQIDAALKAVKS
ncbi:MAG: S41 family peptidase [Bacillota bacterium]|nr:S41 family peptidase [Bacillota bacterium]